MIRPKRSILTSRSEAQITRKFRFRHAAAGWTGLPLIASNMDTIGTFQMAASLSQFQALVALHKYYSASDLIEFFGSEASRYAFFTIGTSSDDWQKLMKVQRQVAVPMINIDVANGYRNRHEHHTARGLRTALFDEMLSAACRGAAKVDQIGRGTINNQTRCRHPLRERASGRRRL